MARQFCDSGASLAYSYTYDGYDTLGDGDGDGKDSIQWMLESSLATLNPSRPGGVKAKFFTGDDENNTRPAFYLSLFNVSHGVMVAWKLRDDAVYLLDTEVRERGRRHLARDEHVFFGSRHTSHEDGRFTSFTSTRVEGICLVMAGNGRKEIATL